MIRRWIVIVVSLALLPALAAQSLRIELAGLTQARALEPLLFGPSLGLRLVDLPKDFSTGIRYNWLSGNLADEPRGYRLSDNATQFGVSLSWRVFSRNKVQGYLGMFGEVVNTRREASGYNLTVGRIYEGSGYMVSFSGRADYAMGEFVNVFLSVEQGCRWYSSFEDRAPDEPILGRPLANGWYGGGCLGVSLVIKSDESENRN